MGAARGAFASVHAFTIRYRTGEDTALSEHRDEALPHVAFFATRDIAAGEELYVTYGATYWRGRMRRRNQRISDALSSFL